MAALLLQFTSEQASSSKIGGTPRSFQGTPRVFQGTPVGNHWCRASVLISSPLPYFSLLSPLSFPINWSMQSWPHYSHIIIIVIDVDVVVVAVVDEDPLHVVLFDVVVERKLPLHFIVLFLLILTYSSYVGHNLIKYKVCVIICTRSIKLLNTHLSFHYSSKAPVFIHKSHMTHPSHWRREPTTYRALFFILKWLILRFNDKTYWNHSFITLQLLWNFYKAEKTYWTEPWTKCFSLDERDWWSPTNQEVFWLFIMLILLMHF